MTDFTVLRLWHQAFQQWTISEVHHIKTQRAECTQSTVYFCKRDSRRFDSEHRLRKKKVLVSVYVKCLNNQNKSFSKSQLLHELKHFLTAGMSSLLLFTEQLDILLFPKVPVMPFSKRTRSKLLPFELSTTNFLFIIFQSPQAGFCT